MSRILRIIAEVANIFNGAFGTTHKRPFSRESLENLIGHRASRLVMAVPVITVVLWLVVYTTAKYLDLPAGENPFSWIHNIVGK